MDRTHDVAYAPGDWAGLAGPGMWLLAELDPVGATAKRCWDLVRAGAEVDAVLEALLAAGFNQIGSFALAKLDGFGARIVVRGHAVAEHHVTGGPLTSVEAGPRATWLDRDLDLDPAGGRLVLRDGGRPVGDARLPLDRGLVTATALDIIWTSAAEVEAEELSEPNKSEPSEPVDATVPIEPIERAANGGDGQATVRRAALVAAAVAESATVPVSGPTVLAAYCPVGHLSAAYAAVNLAFGWRPGASAGPGIVITSVVAIGLAVAARRAEHSHS
jgi:hypothetical protein